MFRKTITIFSLIGLILSLTAWGLSYYPASGASNDCGAYGTRVTGIRMTRVVLFKGRLFFLDEKWQNGVDVGASRWRFNFGRSPFAMSFVMQDRLLPRAGKLSTEDMTNEITSRFGYVDRWGLWCPLYFPSLFFALLCCYYPLVSHCRRRIRGKRGQCVKCGYDLRGSKERCPECGRECEAPKPMANG